MSNSTRSKLVPGLLVLTLASCRAGDVVDPHAATDLRPTAAASLATATAAKVVLVPVSGVEKATSTVKVGKPATFTAQVYDATGKLIPATSAPKVIYASSNRSIFPIDSLKGVGTALTAGTFVLTVKAGAAAVSATYKASGTAQPTPTPTPTPPPPSTSSWTFCTAAGASCDFIGLRDVRLAPASGTPAVIVTAYHSVPCATYGFGDQDPAPGAALHCDYGPLKTGTLSNPMPGMGPLAASTVTVPLGAPGAGGPQSRTTTEVPAYVDGSGAFRTTCSLALYAFNDPIVFPGQPGASHLHAFFGNAGVTPGSTPQTLVASGNSTCRGGSLNRTAYWVPALVDTRTGDVVAPDEGVFYYKTGYNVDPRTVQPFPAGLRMIAGNKSATSLQPYVYWECRDKYVSPSATVPTSCPVGDAVRLTVQFPQCWDGQNVDSPNHQNHMAYPDYRNPPQRSTCPATHPIVLPEITEHFDYPVVSGSAPAYWRLASDMYSTSTRGGMSAHADWMNGWDPTTLRTIVTQCLNRGLDCGVGTIGNGRELY